MTTKTTDADALAHLRTERHGLLARRATLHETYIATIAALRDGRDSRGRQLDTLLAQQQQLRSDIAQLDQALGDSRKHETQDRAQRLAPIRAQLCSEYREVLRAYHDALAAAGEQEAAVRALVAKAAAAHCPLPVPAGFGVVAHHRSMVAQVLRSAS